MQLSQLFQPGSLSISFELFPPKTEAGEKKLMEHVAALAKYNPNFYTCTYGAGGSTRDKTLDIVTQVKQQLDVPVASHLTCVGSTVEMLRDFLTEARNRDIDYIVALRGDPPKGESEFKATEGGLKHANELVSLIRDEFPEFGIAVAGYPEVHQEASSAKVDLENLQRKVDAGADIVITQLFYRNEDFWDFRERYDRAGIDVPLVPGILPVTSLAQIQRITCMCGARLPKDFLDRLGEKDDPNWQMEIGVDQATEQVRQLIDAGAPGLHFYVLNKSRATSRVLDHLRLSRC